MVVTNSNDQNPNLREVFGIPMWMWVWGAPALLACAAFAARIVWEETLLTWTSGPQMIGFSLAHGSGAILLLSPLLLFPFAIVLMVLIARSLIKRRSIMIHAWVMLGLTATVLGVIALPYGFWQRMFAGKLADSSYAGEFMTYAAGTEDFGTVKALISHGVPVNVTDRSGRTALHNAAAVGRVDMLQYLVSLGANINSLDRYGDTPLEVAASQGKNQAVQYLTSLGAKRIRGDEAQRQKASEEMVREDIEKMHRGTHP